MQAGLLILVIDYVHMCLYGCTCAYMYIYMNVCVHIVFKKKKTIFPVFQIVISCFLYIYIFCYIHIYTHTHTISRYFLRKKIDDQNTRPFHFIIHISLFLINKFSFPNTSLSLPLSLSISFFYMHHDLIIDPRGVVFFNLFTFLRPFHSVWLK